MAKKNNDQVITLKVSEENPEPVDLIVKEIIAISEAFTKLQKSKLSKRAIVLLIHDSIPSSAGIGKKDIETILYYAPRLKDFYINK